MGLKMEGNTKEEEKQSNGLELNDDYFRDK